MTNNNPMVNLANHISNRALSLMQRKNLIVAKPERPVFYAWPLPDRLVLVVDPEMVRDQSRLIDEKFKFQHDLSTILGGRKVITTNSRGIFIQVAYNMPPVQKALRSVPLDLSQQPSPLHVPIGMRREGPFWLSITELDVAVIGGRRRMGKTRVIHGMIMALLNGGQCELYLNDGKGGMEFERYNGQSGVHMAQNDLRQNLLDVMSEMQRREPIQTDAGATSTVEFNEMHPSRRMPYLVVVIDEIADVPEDCIPLISKLVRVGGAYGVYMILATTYPDHKNVESVVKANATRIALPVPTQNESRVILGQKGAESMPNIQGRMLMEWQARLIELQAFIVAPPAPKTASYGPRMTADELKIAKGMFEREGEGKGLVSIRLLKEFHGMTEWKAGQLLREWEARGWVEKDPDNSNARCMTSLLRRVLAQNAESPITPQASITDSQGEQNE